MLPRAAGEGGASTVSMSAAIRMVTSAVSSHRRVTRRQTVIAGAFLQKDNPLYGQRFCAHPHGKALTCRNIALHISTKKAFIALLAFSKRSIARQARAMSGRECVVDVRGRVSRMSPPDR